MTAIDINIRTERQDRTVHKARLLEPEIHRIVVEAIAAKLGVHLAGDGVSVRAYTGSHQEGSLGTSKPTVEVELVIDHLLEPKAAP